MASRYPYEASNVLENFSVFTCACFTLYACAVTVVVSATPAQAQTCTTSISNADFGVVNPLDNQQVLTQATMTATCTGSSNQTARVCLHLGQATFVPRHMFSGANQLYYDIYQDAARTQRWGSFNTPGSGTPTPLFIQLPAEAGTQATGTRTLYMTVFAGQQTAVPGSYLIDFGGSQTAVQVNSSTSTTCGSYSVTQRAPFTISATVDEACNFNADSMDFGTQGLLLANVDALANVNVQCTSTTGYTMALGNGQNGSSPTTRRMALGGNFIDYDLYTDNARTTVAGSGVGETIGGVGSGLTTALPVYGRVPPQITPPAGTYTDVVVVTVSY